MSENLNQQVIVGFYESSEAADKAAEALKDWDDANDDIKLGSMGRIVLDDDEVKISRYGTSKTGKGAMLGGVLGLVAAGVTGGLSLLAGAVAGGAVGGVAGKLTHETFGLSKQSMDKIKQHIEKGGAGLVVLCDDYEVEATMKELKNAGGEPHSFGVSTKVLASIHDDQVQEARWKMQTDNIERGY